MKARAELTIVIPNYNGETLLRRNLPLLHHELKREGIPSHIIVVDDASTDGSLALLKTHKDITVIARRKNGGFARAANTGIAAVKTPVLFLLNTDVVPTHGIRSALEALRSHQQWFGISAVQLLPGGGKGGAAVPEFRHGLLRHRDAFALGRTPQTPFPVLFPGGGAALLRTDHLRQLGGFDEGFNPFYWEDADLGWRAWQRGWASICLPDFVVRHEHSPTIGKHFSPPLIRRIAIRNLYRFNWRGLWGSSIWMNHLAWVIAHLARALVCLDGAYLAGFTSALMSTFTKSTPHHPRRSFFEVYRIAGGLLERSQ